MSYINPAFTSRVEMADKWHCETGDDVLSRLGSTERGLEDKEARSRLEKYGPNEIVLGKGLSPWRTFFKQFKSVMVIILIIAAGISASLSIINNSAEEWLDAGVIAVIVLLNAILGFFQEFRAEKTIEALKSMAAPKANVLRDGKLVQVDSRNLVIGDVITLSAGDKVPADGRLIEAMNLKVNEASLTGESIAVPKTTDCVAEDSSLFERSNMIHAGTVVEYGRGRAVVTSTGMSTAIGKIAELVIERDDETPLQKKLTRLGKQLGVMVLGTCIFIFAIGLLQNIALDRMLLTSISLAVAAIPEGLPAVVTVSLALGLQRMAKRNAVVRHLPAVEALGSATVICTDKTGTLTKGEMNIREIEVGRRIEVTGEGFEPVGEFIHNGSALDLRLEPRLDKLIVAGALCNDAVLEHDGDKWKVRGDPTEGTLLVIARKAGKDIERLTKEWPRILEVPFDSKRKRMVTVHEHEGKRFAYLKGATESVLSICTKIVDEDNLIPLDEQHRSSILAQTEDMAQRALRVLAIGYLELDSDIELSEKDLEQDFNFLGLVGMLDAPRKEAFEAVAKCKRAGIRVIMITGDHELTARAIAIELGIAEAGSEVINGKELETIDLGDLALRLKNVSVFARVAPEHKMKIVEALQRNNEIVAMTGDGVNDAPALNKADIGISMGITGTDVAKEASEIVLIDDNFASIVNAVQEGRGIYSNIRKFVAFLLACNAGEVAIMFLAMLVFVDPLVLPFLLPIQILWVNLVTDGFPALALGLERTSSDVMEQPPLDPKAPPISRAMVLGIMAIAMVMTLSVLVAFQMEYLRSVNDLGLSNAEAIDHARTAAFCTLVMAQLLYALSARSPSKTLWRLGPFSNRKLVLAILVSLGLQLFVVYVPGINGVFGNVALDSQAWLLILPLSALAMVLSEAWKAVHNRISNSSRAAGDAR
jgi:Ca2+-transporting ATPase